MSQLWLICGAGRGVGKTHLAMRLCEVLPDAIYAKRGHAQSKTGRPENYFTDNASLLEFVNHCRARHQHIVVEHHNCTLAGSDDIIIFVGPIDGETDVRDDAEQLRNNADILLTAGRSIRSWRRVLRQKLPYHSVSESVLDLLVEHQKYLSQSCPSVRCKLWFVCGDVHLFGSGLAQLLELAARHGTLREAANITNMSYRHAWNLIKTAEKHLDRRLLLMHPGGATGGYAELTDHGRHFLHVYRRLQEEVTEFAEQRFAFHCKQEDRVATEASH